MLEKLEEDAENELEQLEEEEDEPIAFEFTECGMQCIWLVCT